MTRLEALASRVPWWAKIMVKLGLSRLRIPYRAWRRIGIFVHGSMDDPDYAWRVFREHLDHYHAHASPEPPGTVLEIGPGDSAFSGAFGAALGVRKTYLVDAVDCLRWDASSRRTALAFLQNLDPALALPDGEGLTAIRTEYLTQGLDSLRQIPSASVDLIWSQAVLEHLPVREFPAFLTEMRRILKPGGILSHRIDLKDHLGGGLNHLRLPECIWESRLFHRSGFYTNRLRRNGILDAFRLAGFEVLEIAEDRWPTLPTLRERLTQPFQSLPEDELLVSGLNLVLCPARGG